MEGERAPGVVLSRLQRAYAQTTEGQRWTTALALAGTVIFLLFGLRTEPKSQLPPRLDTPPLATQAVGETSTATTAPPPPSTTPPPPNDVPPPPPPPGELGEDAESDESTDDVDGANDPTPTTTSPPTTQPPPSDGPDDGDDGGSDDGGLPELPVPTP